ncbi:MAG: MBL fold metallo-hydrolase [Patescibacteria group bacterium]|nr:MAG: MBL fold metallo-hydrolase [Patescibacteria group bacterium]
MEIKYLGHSSFLIKTKTAKIVTDPFSPEMTGLKFPKVEADIITVSHDHSDHNNVEAVQMPLPPSPPPLIINMPGEFEKMGVRVFGFRSFHDNKNGEERGENVIYKIEAEGANILHCGDLGHVPNDSFLENIGDVDILLVPTGGFYTIGPDEVIELIKKIEPSIIIPMHFNHEKLNQKNFGYLKPLTEFTKKFGIENPVPQQKLVYKKEEEEEEMKVVVLEI